MSDTVAVALISAVASVIVGTVPIVLALINSRKGADNDSDEVKALKKQIKNLKQKEVDKK